MVKMFCFRRRRRVGDRGDTLCSERRNDWPCDAWSLDEHNDSSLSFNKMPCRLNSAICSFARI